jgi:hypothetical protein
MYSRAVSRSLLTSQPRRAARVAVLQQQHYNIGAEGARSLEAALDTTRR